MAFKMNAHIVSRELISTLTSADSAVICLQVPSLSAKSCKSHCSRRTSTVRAVGSLRYICGLALRATLWHPVLERGGMLGLRYGHGKPCSRLGANWPALNAALSPDGGCNWLTHPPQFGWRLSVAENSTTTVMGW